MQEYFSLAGIIFSLVIAVLVIPINKWSQSNNCKLLFLTILALSFVVPYDFESLDSQILTKIYNYKDHIYFSKDLAINSAELIGGYNYFAMLFSLVPSRVLSEAFYFTWLLHLCFIALVVFLINEKLLQSKHSFLSTVIVMAGFFLTFKIGRFGGFILGDNDLIYNWFRHQSLSLVLGLSSLYFYLTRRYKTAGLLLGFSTDFHINTAQHILILLVADMLIFNRKDFRKIVIGFVLMLVSASITIWPSLVTELLSSKSDIENPYILISGFFRHPHHLIYSSWPKVFYMRFFILLLAGAIAWKLKIHKTDMDLRMIGFVYYSLLCLFLGWLFVEVFPIDFIGKTQLARVSIFIKLIIFIYISDILVKTFIHIKDRFIYATSWVKVPFIKFRINKAFVQYVLVALLLFLPLTGIHKVYGKPVSGLESFFLNQTAKDALVMIPVDYKFSSFAPKTKRSTVVDIKRIPFTGQYCIEYYRRICDQLKKPVVFEKEYIKNLQQSYNKYLDFYHANTDDDVKLMHNKYGFDYIVRLTKYNQLKSFPLVYKDKEYFVYKTM